jgi:hypothetical protein
VAKVFLAAPFSNKVHPLTGVFEDRELEETITALVQAITSMGHVVESPHIRDVWGQKLRSPADCTRLSYTLIGECDILIALPGDPPSGGVHLEIGWASALRKKIVLILKYGQSYSPLVEGLQSIADVSVVRYSACEELCRSVAEELSRP